MTDLRNEPTKAEQLAAVLTGRGETAYTMAAVQRSHRFPLHIFAQIENMAKMAGSPVSLIINELLECGLESVKKELPADVAREVAIYTSEQVSRPTVTATDARKKLKSSSKAKVSRVK